MSVFLSNQVAPNTFPRGAILMLRLKRVCRTAALDRCQPTPTEFVRVKQARASRVVARPRPMTPLIRESGVYKATANAGGVLLPLPPVRAISKDQSLSVRTADSFQRAAIKQPGSVL